MIPKELLDYLLEGNTLKPDDLDQFIQENPEEGQYLDYKDGLITTSQERAKGRQIIREYVNGFANSDGGILIVGVGRSKPREIKLCTLPGSEPLDKWAENCVHDMAPFFSPPPRFQVVDHPKGLVLVIAVARAPSLVYCVKSGQPKYFLRINQTTLEAPAYLISDLVLGKRQHPLLDLHDSRITDEGNHEIKDTDGGNLTSARRIIFSFTVENLSLATADDVKIGVVSWSLGDGPAEDINRHLRAYLDVEDIGSQSFIAYQFHLVHRSSVSSGKKFNLEPFQTCMVQNIGPFYFPQDIPVSIVGAVYVVPRGAPPIWFQLECTYRAVLGGNIVVKRKGSGRPHVAIMPPTVRSKA